MTTQGWRARGAIIELLLAISGRSRRGAAEFRPSAASAHAPLSRPAGARFGHLRAGSPRPELSPPAFRLRPYRIPPPVQKKLLGSWSPLPALRMWARRPSPWLATRVLGRIPVRCTLGESRRQGSDRRPQIGRAHV